MILPLLLSVALQTSAPQTPTPDIVGTTVEYTAPGGVTCEGYVAYDRAKIGKRPLVLIVHDWDGVDEYEQRRARELAELGYVGFAVDVYGKGVRPEGDARGATAGKYAGNPTLFRERLRAGYAKAIAMKEVDRRHIGAIGYCFGGGGVLEMGRAGLPLAALVTFHGSLSGSPDDRNIRGRTLVLHGGADPFVPPAKVKEFTDSMRRANKAYRIVTYEGRVHAFTIPEAGDDPKTGAAYDANADAASFEEMRTFLRARLGS